MKIEQAMSPMIQQITAWAIDVVRRQCVETETLLFFQEFNLTNDNYNKVHITVTFKTPSGDKDI